MKLLDGVEEVGERLHLSPLTIRCYRRWIREFLLRCKGAGPWKKPHEVGAKEVEVFLTHLAADHQTAAPTEPSRSTCGAAPSIARASPASGHRPPAQEAPSPPRAHPEHPVLDCAHL
jgi:hypothetical protein